MPEFSQREYSRAAGAAETQFGAGREIEAIQQFWSWLMGTGTGPPDPGPEPTRQPGESVIAFSQRQTRWAMDKMKYEQGQREGGQAPGAPIHALLSPLIGGAKGLESAVEGRLAQTGAGGTGIGTIAGAAGESAAGYAMSDVMQRLFNQAIGLGSGAINRQAGIVGPTSNYTQPTFGEQFFRALGTGLKFLPLPKFGGNTGGGTP